MFKYKLILAVQLGLLILNINCQDTSFCDINSIRPDPLNLQLPALNLTSRYQLSLERNSQNLKLTEEIKEYYDGRDNIGISINIVGGIRTYAYAYTSLNELLLISGIIFNLAI